MRKCRRSEKRRKPPRIRAGLMKAIQGEIALTFFPVFTIHCSSKGSVIFEE
jgi:hypothetical protein